MFQYNTICTKIEFKKIIINYSLDLVGFQVPARRFPDLLDILENDPVINAFPISLKSFRDGPRHDSSAVQTKVPERAWASTRMNEEKTQVIFHRTIFYIIHIFKEI